MADPQDKPIPRASRATIIAQLNDALRQNITSPGRNHVMITPGIADLIGDTSLFRGFRRRAELLRAIRDFDGFGAHVDPYGERDFGSLVLDEVAVFWKIDFYNATLDGGAEDAADPQQSVRVLTIMLANEYRPGRPRRSAVGAPSPPPCRPPVVDRQVVILFSGDRR